MPDIRPIGVRPDIEFCIRPDTLYLASDIEYLKIILPDPNLMSGRIPDILSSVHPYGQARDLGVTEEAEGPPPEQLPPLHHGHSRRGHQEPVPIFGSLDQL